MSLFDALKKQIKEDRLASKTRFDELEKLNQDEAKKLAEGSGHVFAQDIVDKQTILNGAGEKPIPKAAEILKGFDKEQRESSDRIKDLQDRIDAVTAAGINVRPLPNA